jgi:hypothetical protein
MFRQNQLSQVGFLTEMKSKKMFLTSKAKQYLIHSVCTTEETCDMDCRKRSTISIEIICVELLRRNMEDELIYQQKPTCLEYENTQPKYLYEEMKTCIDQRVQAVHNVELLLKGQQKKISSALEHIMNRNIILQRCRHLFSNVL